MVLLWGGGGGRGRVMCVHFPIPYISAPFSSLFTYNKAIYTIYYSQHVCYYIHSYLPCMQLTGPLALCSHLYTYHHNLNHAPSTLITV